MPPFPELQLESCVGWIGNIEASRERVKALLPTAFEPETNEVPGTAGMAFRAYECERVAVNQTVKTSVGVFMLFAHVVPVREEWQTVVFQEFLFDFVVSDAQVAEALRNATLPADKGELAIESWPLLQASENWRIASQHGRAEFAAARAHDSLDAGDLPWYLWYPAGTGFRRVEVNERYFVDQAGPQAGILTGSGMTGFKASETETALAYTGAPTDHHHALLTFNETTYR